MADRGFTGRLGTVRSRLGWIELGQGDPFAADDFGHGADVAALDKEVDGWEFASGSELAVMDSPTPDDVGVGTERAVVVKVEERSSAAAGFPSPGSPVAGGVPLIRCGGVDITGYVEINDCEFKAAVNGAVGMATLPLRDLDRELAFTVGQEITVDVGERRLWGGYLMNVKRRYYYEGSKPLAVTPRKLVLVCEDYNRLWSKRFLFDPSNPTRMQLDSFPSGTADDVVLKYYLEHYVDLTGDGLDIVSLIENVGTPSSDSEISAAAGWSLGQLFAFVGRNIGSIWYINPDKQIVYTDVDTPTAPFGLTDRPVAGGGGGIGDPDNPDFSDDFSRVVAVGLGNDLVYDPVDETGSSVDGSVAHVAEDDQASWNLLNIPAQGTYQFDFRAPVDDPSHLFFIEFEGDLAQASDGLWYKTDFFVTATLVTGQVRLAVARGHNGSAFQYVTADRDDLTPGDWYTARVTYLPDEGLAAMKVWPQGDPAPEAWDVTGVPIGTAAPPSDGQFLFIQGCDGEDTVFDNVKYWADVTLDGEVVVEEGVRELEIEFDGHGLKNDMLVWGAGQGASRVVFSRAEDETSITEHGLWQDGLFAASLWRQATVDRVADSHVNGSPQNKRGGKDDAVSVRCALFAHGLRVADKSNVRSEVFDYEDVLPIREMKLTFERGVPRYDLTLSHEIDAPWSTFEFWFPDFSIDDFPIPEIPEIGLPEFDICFEERDLARFISTVEWIRLTDFFRDSRAFIGDKTIRNYYSHTAIVDEYDGAYAYRDAEWGAPFELLVGFTIDRMNPNVWGAAPPPINFSEGGNLFVIFAGPADDPSATHRLVNMGWAAEGATSGPGGISLGSDSAAQNRVSMQYDFLEGIAYRVRVRYTSDGRARGKFWRSIDPEPASWMLDVSNPVLTGSLAVGVGSLSMAAELPDPRNQVTIWDLRVGPLDDDDAENECLTLDPEDAADADEPQGAVCEVLTEMGPPSMAHDPDNHYFRARTNFVPGTTKVTLDGLFLRPGIDYSEGDAFYGGFISIVDTIDVEGRVVYMCYRADPERGNLV